MDQDIVSENEEERANLVNGARAHEAPTAKQNQDEWIDNMKIRLCNHFSIQLSTSTGSAGGIPETEPSIFYTSGSPLKKFDIGYLLHREHAISVSDDQGQTDMGGYLALMAEWLDLDVKRYLEDMKKEKKRALTYYEEQYQLDLIKDSKHFLESLLASSCFLCFSIILFHDVKKGTKILKGNSTGRIDLRSAQFYRLRAVIMKDQMRTKLDMLCLENQIPWFAVEAVFKNSKLYNPTNTAFTIEKLAMSCFDNLHPQADPIKVDGYNFPPSGGFKHLLHIFHWTRRSGFGSVAIIDPSMFKCIPFAEFYIPNATELLESATVLKKLPNSKVCPVVFHRNIISGYLHLTPMHIFPYSHELYRNLLYFEQKYFKCGLDFTIHFAIIKSLIQTKADVRILEKNDILRNALTGEIDVLNFVNSTGRLLENELNACLPLSLIDLMDEVIKHHRRRFGKEYAKFKRLFFPSRWVLVSILAGTTLAIVTIIQTVYIVLSY